jgi:hypothetical protein
MSIQHMLNEPLNGSQAESELLLSRLRGASVSSFILGDK